MPFDEGDPCPLSCSSTFAAVEHVADVAEDPAYDEGISGNCCPVGEGGPSCSKTGLRGCLRVANAGDTCCVLIEYPSPGLVRRGNVERSSAVAEAPVGTPLLRGTSGSIKPAPEEKLLVRREVGRATEAGGTGALAIDDGRDFFAGAALNIASRVGSKRAQGTLLSLMRFPAALNEAVEVGGLLLPSLELLTEAARDLGD